MIDLLIYGINGKMGRQVYTQAIIDKDFNVTCGIDKHAFGNFNCPVYTDVTQTRGHFDVIIDFSSPSSLDSVLTFAKEYKCALVLATTGYTQTQYEKIKQASEVIPICQTANTSQGVNALYEILPQLATHLNGFDVCISEYHGKAKKDSPSGTAINLKNALQENDCNPQIVSLRAGNLSGIHEISFVGEDEIITVKHVALSRSVFAKGALKIAKKLVNLPAGLYTSKLN